MLIRLFNLIFSLLFITLIGGLQGNIFFILWSLVLIFFIFKFLKRVDIYTATKIFIFLYWLIVVIFYQLSNYNWDVIDVDSDGHMNDILDFDFEFLKGSFLKNIKNLTFWNVRLIVSFIWLSVSKVISFISFENLTDQESQRFLIFQINVLFQILSGFVFTDILKFLRIFIEKKRIYFLAVFIAFCNPGYLYYLGYIGKESLLSLLLLIAIYFSIRVYGQLIKKQNKSLLKNIFNNFINIFSLFFTILLGILARPYFPLLVISSFISTIYFLNIKTNRFLDFINIFSVFLLSIVGYGIARFDFIYLWLGNSAGILMTPNIFRVTNYFDFPFQTFTALFTSMSLFIFGFKKAIRLKLIEIYYLISPFLIAGGCFGLIVAVENNTYGRELTNLAFFLPRTRLFIYQLLVFFIIFKTMRVGFCSNKIFLKN